LTHQGYISSSLWDALRKFCNLYRGLCQGFASAVQQFMHLFDRIYPLFAELAATQSLNIETTD
jgi:hypothetical protein